MNIKAQTLLGGTETYPIAVKENHYIIKSRVCCATERTFAKM
jgi:hypothetical protein